MARDPGGYREPDPDWWDDDGPEHQPAVSIDSDNEYEVMQQIAPKMALGAMERRVGFYRERVITEGMSEVVRQARAEAEQAPLQHAVHEEPDTLAALSEISEKIGQLAAVISDLDNERIPLTRTEVELTIKGLREAITRGNSVAWQLGLHAVEKGLISQVRLAELLDSSSATVSRRYRKGSEQAE